MASKKHRKKIKRFHVEQKNRIQRLEEDKKQIKKHYQLMYGRFASLNPYGPEHS